FFSATGTLNGLGLGISSMSTTSITGTVVLLGPAGSSGITVSTFGGTSGSVTFTVNANSLNAAGFTVSTFAGSAGDEVLARDGAGTYARFNGPRGLTGDGSGNLLVGDSNNRTIRKVVLGTQAVSTLAGVAGVDGASDGTGPAASFSYPEGMWSDGTNLYIADTDNGTIRKMV